MEDARYTRLARSLIQYSCDLTVGETVLIESIGAPIEFVVALIREAKASGATPLVSLKDDLIMRELARQYSDCDIKMMADCELHVMKKADAFITIRATQNAAEYVDVGDKQMGNILRHYIEPVHYRYRNDNVKWVALRWPTPAMAERAGMSTEAFEQFFFQACDIDYKRMADAMRPLADRMANAKEVRVVGPGETDLAFSIKGIGHYKSVGRHNLPDGEIFTAPVKNSVNGQIHFNVSSTYYGATFDDTRLKMRDGKIVDATASNLHKLAQILDQDDGSRFLGEFAFGVHPQIRRPIRDILFDEKLTGSLHFAIGNSYSSADNGNRSSVHWDLVLLQTLDAGGGEVYFDDALIRKDGRFVPTDLAVLNPENLG